MTTDLAIAFARRSLKRCAWPACHAWLDPCNFTIDRSRPDGLARYCRGCDRQRSLVYRQGRREAVATLALFGGGR